MRDSSQPVKVRIAPSPTGEPHVGTAYIGLFNLAFARKNGGTFILRIEDTDQERSTKESEQSIFTSLRWLSLIPDEGPEQGGPGAPYRQSERTGVYREHAEMLVQRGTAYRCFCTKERLDELRARQQAAGAALGYDGHCRSLGEDEVRRRLEAGEPSVIRLRMPTEGTITVRDLLRGDVTYQNELIDDQVLLKSDGFPTYHLANVVDDHLMGVTHVIRAEEWIPSTPKHVELYRAFGWLPPTFVHMPLLRNPDKGKSKISKRKNPVSLLYYKRRGFLPEALLNYLGLMGWSFPEEGREKFTLDEFFAAFDITRVSLGGPVFDLSKLEWMNGLYIRDMARDDLVRRLDEHCAADPVWDAATIRVVVPLVQERMVVLGDLDYQAAFYRGTPFLEAATPLIRERGFAAVREALGNLRTHLERSAPYWNEAELSAAAAAMPEGLAPVARMVFAASDEGLPAALFMRGRGMSLRMCQEGADTLKKIQPKGAEGLETATMLRETADLLSELQEWTPAVVEELLQGLAEGKGWKTGTLYMPVRVACTGRAQTPPLFDTMVAVGRDRCVARLRAAAELMETAR